MLVAHRGSKRVYEKIEKCHVKAFQEFWATLGMLFNILGVHRTG
jgi:hypothetical protein